jgi:hypothetical protein
MTDGTLPTGTPLFAVLMIATVLVVGALSYLPVLALGPIVEHLALRWRFPVRGPRTRSTSPLGQVAALLRQTPTAH